MTSIRDSEIDAFEIGDIFYECEAGMNIEARVKTKPVSEMTDIVGEMRKQWRWTAENTQSGEEIAYLLTDGLSCYGPRLYRSPQYVMFKDGIISVPLVGAPEPA